MAIAIEAYCGYIMRLATTLPILIAITSSTAYAGDSSWLLCKGTGERGTTKMRLVANLHEHRSASGDSRDVSVTLVYGDHVARGTIANQEADHAGALEVKHVDGGKIVMYTGTATLDQAMKTFTLKGQIDENFGAMAKPSLVKLTAKLTCENVEP